jgi:hypothetical protein
VREVHETGTNIITVPCPNGIVLLDDDAVGSEGLEDRSWVMDISEIVAKVYDISTYLQYMQ